MDIEKIYKELSRIIEPAKILKNEPMKKHTSFKIGGNADLLVRAGTIEDVRSVLKFCKENDIPLYVIGNGSNILVKDDGIRGIVLTIQIDTLEIEKQEQTAVITVGAGVKLAKLAVELLKEEIEGFEFASRNTRNYRRGNKNECRSTW